MHQVGLFKLKLNMRMMLSWTISQLIISNERLLNYEEKFSSEMGPEILTRNCKLA